jgi:hypothetical protein
LRIEEFDAQPEGKVAVKIAKIAKRIWRATLEAGFPFRMIGRP